MSFREEVAHSMVMKAWKGDRMAHGWLISGEKDRGVALMLRLLGDFLEAGPFLDWADAQKRGEVFVLEPKSKSRQISVKDLRDLEKSLSLVGSRSVFKFGIIVDADRMTDQAQNAFLKTLEEPGKGTFLFLLTSAPELLLDTTRSRCLELELQRKQGGWVFEDAFEERLVSLIHAYLERPQSTPASALFLMKQFKDLLEEAKKAIEKEESQAFSQEKKKYADNTDGTWVDGREEEVEALISARYRLKRDRLLSMLMTVFGDALRLQSGVHESQLDLQMMASSLAKWTLRLSRTELSQRYEILSGLQRDLSGNINEALALEVAFLRSFA